MADTAATTRRINRALTDLGLNALPPGVRLVVIDAANFDGSDGVLITPTFLNADEAFQFAGALERIVERLPEPDPVQVSPDQQAFPI